MLVPLLIDTSVLWMSIVPLLSPMLLNLVVLCVDLAPVLSFLLASVEVYLPLVAPLFSLVLSVDLTPLFVPLFLGVIISAPFLAVAFLNLVRVVGI